MTESRNQNQMVLYALGGIIVLLVAVVGVLVARNQSPVPAPTPVANSQAPNGANTGNPGAPTGGAPTGMPPQQQAAAPTEFDPKTATKVPAGIKPEEYINKYYEYVKAGNYAEAFKILPKDKQAYYGNAEGYASTLKSYNITGVSVDKPVIGKDTVTVTGWQETPAMGSFGYTWTLAKVGNDWYVKSRDQAGTK